MREVEFLLTAKADPASQQVIRDFGQSIARAQKSVSDGPSQSLAQKAIDQQLKGADTLWNLQNKHARDLEALKRAGFALDQQLDAKRIASAQQLEQALNKVAEERQAGAASPQSLAELVAAQKNAAQVIKETDKSVADNKRQLSQQEAASQRQAASESKALRTAEANEQKRIAREQADRQRQAAAQSRENSRIAELNNRAFVKAEQEKARETQRVAKQSEQQQARSLSDYQRRIDQANGAGRELLQSFAETSESVMKLARGMVFFGLTGETELQKVQDSLLAMQGTIDLTVGGTKLFLGMEKAMRLFNTATIAATAAQEALNAARLKGATISSVEGAAQLTGLGGMAARGGAAMMGGAAALAGRMGAVGMAGVGAGAAGTAAAGLTALAGAAFGVVSSFRTLQEASQFGFGGGAQAGGFVESIGASAYNPFSGMASGGQLAVERSRSKEIDRQFQRFQQISALNQEDEARKEESQQSLNERIREQYDLTAKTWELSRRGLSDQEQLESIVLEAATLQNAAAKGSESASARILSLREQELSLSQRIADQQRTMAQEMIAANREALSTVEQRIAAEEEATQSAAVRFGLMDEANQQEIVMLRERLAAGQQLSAQELGRLRGLSQEIDAEIELQALRRAQAAGFDRLGITQASERRQGALESMREMLSVELESSIDFSVQIQSNAEATAQAVTAQIRQLYDRDIGSIATRVADLTKEVANIDARIQRRANGG